MDILDGGRMDGIYADISARTDGALFLGVVGPVRSGKSTFIRRAMELLVLPGIPDGAARQRMTDELPQSGSGRTIMTTQPKFVPSEAATVSLNPQTSCQVRMVDCVGYMVPGALGATEADMPRMVRTPWSDEDMPFERAAELGTQKVIRDHSTVGILVTTDGTIAELPRISYVRAEELVAAELRAAGRPFVIVLNSAAPAAEEAISLRAALAEKYGVPVVLSDVKNMGGDELRAMLEAVLYEFPLTRVDLEIPDWVCALDDGHWLIEKLVAGVRACAPRLEKVSDWKLTSGMFDGDELLGAPTLAGVDLATGVVRLDAGIDRGLFYRVVGEECGAEIGGDMHLIALLKELMHAKQEYDRVAGALRDVREHGYGLVPPTRDELTLEEPEVVRQGGRFGVRLKASGPSLHLMRVDIESVITPIIGAEQESERMVERLLEQFEHDPARLWETEMFGRSLNDLITEGLSAKLLGMPEEARGKIQLTLQRIVNEGSGGLICILL